MGMVDFTEPFSSLLNQGMVVMDGSAMSKSRGNLVRLSDELVDTVWTPCGSRWSSQARLRMTSIGQMSPSASVRFLTRAWRLSGDVTSEPEWIRWAVTSPCDG